MKIEKQLVPFRPLQLEKASFIWSEKIFWSICIIALPYFKGFLLAKTYTS